MCYINFADRGTIGATTALIIIRFVKYFDQYDTINMFSTVGTFNHGGHGSRTPHFVSLEVPVTSDIGLLYSLSLAGGCLNIQRASWSLGGEGTRQFDAKNKKIVIWKFPHLVNFGQRELSRLRSGFVRPTTAELAGSQGDFERGSQSQEP